MEDQVMQTEAEPQTQGGSAAPARSKTKRNILIVVLSLCIAVMLLVWIVIGYLLSVICGFYRLPDVMTLEVSGAADKLTSADGEFTVMTYNVGFGAYSPEYTFFMDTGIMKDGTPTVGEHGTAISKADVEKNISGSAKLIERYSPDFAIVQEVDFDSTRSYKVDQRVYFRELADYCSVFAENYHSSYLFYPFSDPIGASNSGIITLSKHAVTDSTRYSFPIADDLSKLTDLDRCFSVTHIPVGGGTLSLISLHMSAYDEGGVIRKLQADKLKDMLTAEYEKGYYVIAGGDFNQDLIGNLEKFESDQKIPEWVSSYDTKDIPEHFAIRADNNSDVGSCRGADVKWERNKTYTCVIDGFIVSDNIDVTSVSIIDNDFAFSDHNPVLMTFKFNAAA